MRSAAGCLLCFGLLAALPARADWVLFTTGHRLEVASYRVQGRSVVLQLSKGSMTVARLSIEGIAKKSDRGEPVFEPLPIPSCPARDGDDLTLHDDAVVGRQTYEVCHTLLLGPNFQVAGPNGDLSLRAGQRIMLQNGFTVEAGATLRVTTAPYPESGSEPGERLNR